MPDLDTFGCLRLAMEAAESGEGVRLNAANEEAVRFFLEGKVAFTDIAGLVGYAAEALDVPTDPSITEIFEIDSTVRRLVEERAEAVAKQRGR